MDPVEAVNNLGQSLLARVPSWVASTLAFVIVTPIAFVLAALSGGVVKRLLARISVDEQAQQQVGDLITPAVKIAVAEAVEPRMDAFEQRMARLEGKLEILVGCRDQS